MNLRRLSIPFNNSKGEQTIRYLFDENPITHFYFILIILRSGSSSTLSNHEKEQMLKAHSNNIISIVLEKV